MAAPVNPAIASLSPYKPGKPIEELARELGLSDIIKLASNENPRGPGAAVQTALQSTFADLSRYPDGGGYRLKHALAERLNIQPAQITLGNGSNDVLELMAKVALTPGTEAIAAEHCFIVYPIATQGASAEFVSVAAQHYGADLDAFLDAVTERTRLVFLANPNNPTGTWIDRTALTRFLDALSPDIWVVLDEAYFEYVQEPGYPDGLALLGDYPNLLVTRTFSKIHGLASLRIGYGVSSPELADLLNRARQPFNVNSLALVAAEASLDDDAYVQSSRQLNTAGLEQLQKGLTDLQLDCIPSVANFVTVDVGTAAAPVFQALLEQGVIVRTIAEYGLPNHLRVSCGLPEENERALGALRRVLGR